MFSALMPSPWASVAFVAGTILDLQLADSFARVLGSAAEAGAVELMPIGLGEPRRIVVARGFAEVTSDHCVVLAEDSAFVADLDRAGLEQRLSDAREDIEDATTDEERHHAEAAVALFEEMLRAVG